MLLRATSGSIRKRGILPAVTSANVDLVRSLYVRWERGDWSSAEWASPEIEYVVADGPAPGRWTGIDGLAKGWNSIMGTWEDFRVEADEYRELDDERVLVLHRWSGRGKTSGLELGQMSAKTATLYHVRDDKVTKIVHYFDREHALADLGLSSDSGSSRS